MGLTTFKSLNVCNKKKRILGLFQIIQVDFKTKELKDDIHGVELRNALVRGPVVVVGH